MSSIQYNPLHFPVYVLAKPIGAACNLRCDYCYYLEKQVEGASPQMREEMLERFTKQYVQAQPGQVVLFTWHGGEPLLLGVDFFRKALRYQQAYKRNYKIDNVLQTNGTLLTDEWCLFFKEKNFLIGLSLDGPEHCHDKYRQNIAGRGSFAQTMKGLELLQKHGVEFNILSVVNDYNVQFPKEVYRFFKSIGAAYIQFSPVVERLNNASGGLQSGAALDGTLTEWSVPSLAYGQFLSSIFEEWVRTDVGRIFVTTFDATLAGYAGVVPGTCLYAETCGHAAALEINGDLYACDHFVFPNYKLGNIRQKTITEMMLSDNQIRFGNDKRDRLPKKCIHCKFIKLCRGECPKNRFIMEEGEKYPLNYLCEGLKHYFSQTEVHMQFMLRELNEGRAPSNVMEALNKSN